MLDAKLHTNQSSQVVVFVVHARETALISLVNREASCIAEDAYRLSCRRKRRRSTTECGNGRSSLSNDFAGRNPLNSPPPFQRPRTSLLLFKGRRLSSA